jgi:hypothetical protein
MTREIGPTCCEIIHTDSSINAARTSFQTSPLDAYALRASGGDACHSTYNASCPSHAVTSSKSPWIRMYWHD